MRPRLLNGRLTPPTSTAQALAWLKECWYEQNKILAQLDDEKRVLTYPSTAVYDRWRESARAALKCFRSEERQLGEWLEAPHPLFREAYDLLCKLEIEIDFEDDETALMEKLDAHFSSSPKEEKKTA